MHFKFQQNQLNHLKDRLSLMVFLVFGLLASNLILICMLCYMHFHQRIEITPFFSNSGYVKSESQVDATYLKLMSENFVFLRLNVTPESVLAQQKQLLGMVSSKVYPKFAKVLEQEANLISEQKISSHFDVTHLQVDPHQLSCKIKGVLHRSVGIRRLDDEPLQYRLKFNHQLGRLSLIQFVKEPLQ